MEEVKSTGSETRGRRPLAIIFLFGFAYAAFYCLWYAGTPMGAHPVLDGKENLQLAWGIADGILANEPFYRAPVYPLAISLGMGLGLPEFLWPDFARLINLVAWLTSLWLVSRLAMELWCNERAALLATGVWALYPVGLFFLGDPLDITLSIALLLGGLDRATAFLRTASPQSALATGFLLALAALTRPQMWSVALAIPIILAVLAISFHRQGDVDIIQPGEKPLKPPPRWPVVLTLVGLALPSMMMGAFNKKVSGEFVIMPTQGPFNLWAANKPGAHGKYFAQEIEVYQNDEHENPARVESIYHYRKDRGADASMDWNELNDYWRQRTREMIIADPVGFLGRLARKGYYLLNNYEQYNNKTYFVHKALSPQLRFNFLGWGLLLTTTAPLLIWGRKNPLLLMLILGTAVAYAAGLILTYVSARFRLPLAPMLAVIVGGWATLPWRELGRKRLVGGGGLMLLVGVLSFSSLFAVREPKTEIQDYLLLGYAALEAGQDHDAIQWAERAITEDYSRLAARELRVVAQYNLSLAQLIEKGSRPSGLELEAQLNAAQQLSNYSPRVNYITGVYEWWHGDSDAARQRWLMLVNQPNSVAQSSLTGLIMTGPLTTEASAALARIPETVRQNTLEVALAHAQKKPLNDAGYEILKQLEAVYAAP
ncbi:hypothetical protein [Cerasicoccus arenae]|uniref:Glycosyltransferase RgtA/B/C/D-like domain-containing protein n=1 Tax=Cerasicoccus arenae TaxID=424488 RepID=A0A8J3DH25_9BACT|nr:hypothetical protein [Cerasicoccus arenae]MBK1858556.1 hypothetical protein [Cerasicoccus arenae]GHC06275.1 hypothetical protein GCM10007047_24220 [Cerasicoccus arenae]